MTTIPEERRRIASQGLHDYLMDQIEDSPLKARLTHAEDLLRDWDAELMAEGYGPGHYWRKRIAAFLEEA
jgi:hypothetical protein